MTRSQSDEVTQPTCGRTSDETHALRSGSVVGNFRVRRLLGSGASGLVYAAVDELLERDVALKVLRQTASLDWGIEREGSAMARVSHPNVVPVFGLADFEGHDVLVMELVPGESLADVLKRGPATPEDAAYWLDGILAGLAAVHDAGLVHRDVKPANVLLGAFGEAKLCDFGLVGSAAQALGVLEGTPAYCAPEIVTLDEDAPPRAADFYAVGVLAFELLTGRRPFEGDDPLRTLKAHVLEPTPALSSVAPALAAFDDWVAGLLEKDPLRRSTQVDELRASLAKALRIHRARQHGGPAILVADSDVERATRLAATIRTICPGPRVAIASDGRGAERFLAEHSVDLLVVDLGLEGTSGLELCATARASAAPPSVLVTFGMGSAADWKVASRLGASACLMHPCDDDAVEIALRRALQWCGRD